MASPKIPGRRAELYAERAGFSEIQSTYHLDFDWFRRSLDSEDIWFFSSGQGHLVFKNGRKIVLRRGLVVWLRPGDEVEFHHTEDNPNLGVFYFHFDLRKPPGRKKALTLNIPQAVEISDTSFYESCFRRVLFLLQSAPAQSAAQKRDTLETANRLFEEILLQLEYEQGMPPERRLSGEEVHQQQVIFGLVAKIYEHPEKYWDGGSMRRSVGYGRNYLARLFRRIVGKTPRQVLIDARLEKARDLLRNTNLDIVQIAEQLGYGNQFYFCRQFHSLTGYSPTAFRRKCQADAKKTARA